MREVDFVVVGGSPAAVSLAMDAAEAGLERVVIVDPEGQLTAPPESHPDIEVLRSVAEVAATDGRARVVVEGEEIFARAAAVIEDRPLHLPQLPAPEEVADRVHSDSLPERPWGEHVLVVGGSEKAARIALELSDKGANVVLARANASPRRLSRLTRSALLLREAERRLTILWHSRPLEIIAIEGEPLVNFDDIRTPDLVFDDIVLVDDASVDGPDSEGPVWRISDVTIPPGQAWSKIRAGSFPEIPAPPTLPSIGADDEERIEELRKRHYNATITHFHRTHSDLWVIRVEPDQPDFSYQAGQYASLGLGYWEPRVDGARDPGLERKWENLVRRSYSISSPIFDEDGYLHDPATSKTLEFYIVLVPPTADHIPGLTPRLALCGPGDRIYVGPRIVGRYTLAPVRDPESTVVFLATGTGEAPHNAMVTELLRKGHHGPIVSVVCVRYRADLAYLDTHRRLEERFPNYHYLPLVTREPDTEKLYIQDVIKRDLLAENFGVALDPARTHVYLCGNPAMIGLPRWEGDTPIFPETEGVCQLLTERGFQLDRQDFVGNIHTEKYW
ncbi:MAG TPA: hypothetical protein VF377_13165 [Acidimicrobiia bacterium]|jgi:ferredoxin--NADP+ reductase